MGKSTGEGRFEQEISEGLTRHNTQGTPFLFFVKDMTLSKRDQTKRNIILSPIQDKITYKTFKSDKDLQLLIACQLPSDIYPIVDASTEKSLSVIESAPEKAITPVNTTTI